MLGCFSKVARVHLYMSQHTDLLLCSRCAKPCAVVVCSQASSLRLEITVNIIVIISVCTNFLIFFHNNNIYLNIVIFGFLSLLLKININCKNKTLHSLHSFRPEVGSVASAEPYMTAASGQQFHNRRWFCRTIRDCSFRPTVSNRNLVLKNHITAVSD